jgi:hypothetical protein
MRFAATLLPAMLILRYKRFLAPASRSLSPLRLLIKRLAMLAPAAFLLTLRLRMGVGGRFS